MKRSLKFDIALLIIPIFIGQMAFAIFSPRFTTPAFEGRLFATVGFEYTDGDLHKLNEAAHYFGQTIIGWTKFPTFVDEMRTHLLLPDRLTFYAHMQERQNLVFVFKTQTPLGETTLKDAAYFIQSKIDAYNQMTRTRFLLSNLDVESREVTKTYTSGALAVFAASLVVGAGLIFMRRELAWLV